mmetsp:Transcript_23955/g.36705  ORF Transcript_23955/g.36705 Transcript_23955/m.36705 type:complete len:203 (-) Transcript_23955:1975-2583(-)
MTSVMADGTVGVGVRSYYYIDFLPVVHGTTSGHGSFDDLLLAVGLLSPSKAGQLAGDIGVVHVYIGFDVSIVDQPLVLSHEASVLLLQESLLDLALEPVDVVVSGLLLLLLLGHFLLVSVRDLLADQGSEGLVLHLLDPPLLLLVHHLLLQHLLVVLLVRLELELVPLLLFAFSQFFVRHGLHVALFVLPAEGGQVFAVHVV